MGWPWARLFVGLVASAAVGAVVGLVGKALTAAGYENNGIALAVVAGAVAGSLAVGALGRRSGAA